MCHEYVRTLINGSLRFRLVKISGLVNGGKRSYVHRLSSNVRLHEELTLNLDGVIYLPIWLTVCGDGVSGLVMWPWGVWRSS